jgi:hypothetical protein
MPGFIETGARYDCNVGRHGACADGGSHAKGAGGLLHNMVTRFMGLIVIAMGVQVALTGFHQFFS